MRDHSTIGLVITTDGSIGELPRSNYLGAEEKTILALKKSGKPFLVLVNSQKPYSEETRQVAEEIGSKYDVSVMPVNCEQLKKEDIHRILEKILYEFPLTAVEFYFPKWMDMLPIDHAVKQDLLKQIRELMNHYDKIRDVAEQPVQLQGDYVRSCKMDPIQLWSGIVQIQVGIDGRYYYEMLSGMLEEDVEDEYQLLHKLKELAGMKKEYTKVQDALTMVKIKGYGVVTPDREDIALEKPELIRHGNKFGVRIKASSPSIHMIRANIETEIAPIVGTEQQAQDLIRFIDILLQDRLKVQILCICLVLDTGKGHAHRYKFLAVKIFFYLCILRRDAVAFIVIGNDHFQFSLFGGQFIGLGLNVIIALRFLLELEAFDRHNIAGNTAAYRSTTDRSRIAIAKLALIFHAFIRKKDPPFLLCQINKHGLAFCRSIAPDRSLLISTAAIGHNQHIGSRALTIPNSIQFCAQGIAGAKFLVEFCRPAVLVSNVFFLVLGAAVGAAVGAVVRVAVGIAVRAAGAGARARAGAGAAARIAGTGCIGAAAGRQQ